MNAFFSSTDDENENATQFYLVWGKIKDQYPQVAFRYCSGDAKIKICPSVLIDWPMIKERTTIEYTCKVEGFQPEQYVEEKEMIFPGPFPKIDYPSDWMGQHTATRITTGSRFSYGSKTTGGKKYMDHGNGKLDQLYMDFYDDKAWHDAMLDRASGFNSYDYGAMEDAVITKFENPSDEILKNDINDNLMDITADYSLLGYDRVIESTLDVMKKR